MASHRPVSSGIAVRVMRTTLFIGVLTVLAAAVVGVASVGRMSSRQDSNRDLALVQLIEDRIQSRLSVSSEAMARAGSNLVRAPADRYTHELSSAVGTDSPVFSRVVALSPEGDVLASAGEATATGSFDDSPALDALRRGRRGFLTVRPADGPWELWALWAPTKDDPRFYLAGRLDTTFISSALREAAVGDRRLFIVDASGVLVAAGQDTEGGFEQARWNADSANSGRVFAELPGIGGFQGTYVELTETGSLGWRLVVLAPSMSSMRSTLGAVVPSLAVLFFGGLVAVVAAWRLSARLVRPLRELERAARLASSGAYVRSIDVTTDDEVGRVAHAFNQVSLRLNALNDLSQLLASTSNVDQVLDGILDAMGHLLGAGRAAVYLYEETQSALVPARVSGTRHIEPDPVPATGDGWLAEALQADRPLSLNGDDRLRAELPGLAVAHSQALALPLVANGERLGVVVALRGADEAWSEAECETVKAFSAHAAVAVQTSRLFEIESTSRRIAEALRAVAEELVRPDGLERALRRIEAIVAELFGASAVSIVVADRASVALPGGGTPDDARVLAVAMRALRAAADERPAVVVPRGSDGRADELLDRLGGEVLLVVPVALESDHGAVMVIAGDHSLAGVRWTFVAGAVADELALAFDNAYFYERALARAANLETIFRISQAVGSSLQVNVVLNRILDVVQKMLSADAVALLEHETRHKALSVTMARGDVPASIVRHDFVPGDDLPGYVFSSGQPATLRNLHAGMKGLAGDAAATGLHSLLAVPLLARGRSIGVLIVFSKAAGAFSAEETGVLQTFATQAALALDTARLYSREHEVASVLQRSILPEELPVFDELEAGSVYSPAGVGAEIGGDYYDLFRSPSGEIWFAIADVCGKGVQAATKTSMIKYALRAFAAAGQSPAQVLSGLNRMVAESGTPSDIVTAWVGRLDHDSTRLTWANGGHPPGVLRRADGSYVDLGVTGPLLGAIPEVPYDEMCVRMAPGDGVLLYTDGVTEARSGNIFFGEQRVRDAFTGEGTAADTARGLLDNVRRFVRSDLRDDVAVLVVSLSGCQPEAADELGRREVS